MAFAILGRTGQQGTALERWMAQTSHHQLLGQNRFGHQYDPHNSNADPHNAPGHWLRRHNTPLTQNNKQIYDLEARKVITKATYDKDRGVVAIIAEKHLVEILRNYWHDAWKTVHKEHPRYPTYGKFPYATTFAAARLDDQMQDQMEE